MTRVLLVDDDASIRELVPAALRAEGHEVRCAADGAAALRELESYTPDVILLDMRMPGMDGWEFSRAYRARPGQRAPVIVFSAARDAREWAAAVQADGVLDKPFELDELYALVQRFGPTAA